jgi:hypothetical protein
MSKRPPLPKELKRIIRGWAALYVAGPVCVVPKRVGDNRGTRPILFGITESWVDSTISRKLDAASPHHEQRILFRVWCSSKFLAHDLGKKVEQYIKRGDDYDRLRGTWHDLGPYLDVVAFEKAIRLVARDNGIRTWNDRELHQHLRDIEIGRVRTAMARA